MSGQLSSPVTSSTTVNGREEPPPTSDGDLSENKPPSTIEEKDEKEDSVTLRQKGIDKEKRDVKSFSAVEPKNQSTGGKVNVKTIKQ